MMLRDAPVTVAQGKRNGTGSDKSKAVYPEEEEPEEEEEEEEEEEDEEEEEREERDESGDELGLLRVLRTGRAAGWRERA
mmetsp:Transcript_6629/g.20156  ORF Transcript_6629/g.20156 Transcript_6629/m.20156 type:complete len:80 (+) Transcript_6629:162-401(+)|eukprot:CAMPEP_0197390080 /NCGR_PEP_ID=MMETSP1165-20131217/2160_1 /TAXON_ID=284809 /ORGANISM="Chrysocystis fragilis, Strain CCMP3189" /LENGTH=79 /DNA_ID=CAMNT_0042915541 /DNA_START=116 /DNA_END=355 /DNA_ORIENTATION=-